MNNSLPKNEVVKNIKQTKSVNSKKRKSIGEDQEQKKSDSINIINFLLYDGEWHRIIELQKNTCLSTRTLYKRLEELENLKLIERKEGKEKGKYAVYYRAFPEWQLCFKYSLLADDVANELTREVRLGKDPLIALETINNYVELNVLIFIYYMQKDKLHFSNEELSSYLRLWMDIVLWKPFKQFTLTAMDETLKILDEIDIAQIAKSQMFRLQETSKSNAEAIYRMFGIFDKPEKEPPKILSPEEARLFIMRTNSKDRERRSIT